VTARPVPTSEDVERAAEIAEQGGGESTFADREVYLEAMHDDFGMASRHVAAAIRALLTQGLAQGES